jgi:transcriptional regulator with XRE-family HTH domain
MRSLGKNLRKRARELNLSDAEVARRIGLTEQRYGNYVRGEREPDLETLVRICKTLGISPNEALGWETASSPSKQSNTRSNLLAQVMSDCGTLSDEQLELLSRVARAIKN